MSGHSLFLATASEKGEDLLQVVEFYILLVLLPGGMV